MQTAGNSTLRKRRALWWGKCEEVKEGGTIRDSHVNFEGTSGATLLEVHFSPVWYSITEHQPIAKDCVFSEDKIKRVKILAGRHKSEEVRDDFAGAFPGEPELQAQNMRCSTGQDMADFPNKLNFAFGGTMKFTFAQSNNTSFSLKAGIRLAQGHYYHGSVKGYNNWWIAGKDCLKQEYIEGVLICEAQGGAGQIAIWAGGDDLFGVSPFPMF